MGDSRGWEILQDERFLRMENLGRWNFLEIGSFWRMEDINAKPIRQEPLFGNVKGRQHRVGPDKSLLQENR